MDFDGHCFGKTPYASKAAAVERIKHQRKRKGPRRTGRWYGHMELLPYRCPDCHQWHVGNTKVKEVSVKGRRNVRPTA